mmetsp:Transcript_23406/g.51662  ORF Transcript_23406/g.51662 Transcript_23406/m.51662 type:complete len:341 (-) Transcript_23406:157-1179(-)
MASASFDKDDFDKELLAGFQVVHAEGLLRTNLAAVEQRALQGDHALFALYIDGHFKKKRPASLAAEQRNLVKRPVDPSHFNFTKASDKECLGILSINTFEVTILACLSPLATGHVLFVPQIQELLPQSLTTELVLLSYRLLQRTRRSDFRILYNSLSGHATVNHFHVHGFYCEEAKLPQGRLPIELSARKLIARLESAKVEVHLLTSDAWFVPGYVISWEGSQSNACSTWAEVVGYIVEELQKQNSAHNVMFLGFGAYIEAYVLPREAETKVDENAGLNTGTLECCGVILPHSREGFNSLSEEEVWSFFRRYVAMPADFFHGVDHRIQAILAEFAGRSKG